MSKTMNRPGADSTVQHSLKSPEAPWPVQFYQSAIGKKWVMAITGIGMLGFVVAHMIGNLKVYLGTYSSGAHAGAYQIDVYGEALRELLVPIMPHGVVLWLLRIGLLGMLIFHVHSAITLTNLNRSSRGTGYAGDRDYIAANFASRSMRFTGAIIFVYIIVHILDLTIGATSSEFVHGNVYDNMVNSLSRPAVAIGYMIANIAVAVHLFHGVWSMFQSLGFNNPKYNNARKYFAWGIAIVIGIGNLSFPIAILAGIVN